MSVLDSWAYGNPMPENSTDLGRIHNALSGKNGDQQKQIAEGVVKWGALMLRKNADYGSSFAKQPVLAPDCDTDVAIRVRMSDKIERLRSLLASGKAEVSDESIADTVSDLGAYCLLWLICKGK